MLMLMLVIDGWWAELAGHLSCWVYRLLEGGADTGFHHVEPEKYTPRLMHFSGKGLNIVVQEVLFRFLLSLLARRPLSLSPSVGMCV